MINLHNSQDQDEIDSSSEEIIEITRWQFCEGCIQTVMSFSSLLSERLLAAQQKGRKPGSNLMIGNNEDLPSSVCSRGNIPQMKPFVKHSCQKIFNGDSQQRDVMSIFTSNDASPASVRSNTDMYEKNRKVDYLL
jgi:hypothetical protein